MKKTNIRYLAILTVLAVFGGILPLYGQDAGRAPINVNLIIDGSSAFNDAKDEISAWLSDRMDAILIDGDRVTVWSAGSSSKVIYSGVVSGTAEKDAVKKSIRDISGSGNVSDFSGAIRDAASRQTGAFSYTLLISASPHSITGSSAGQLRYSRVEEFTNWRALVVGLNFDSRVKRAANSFFN